MSKPPSKPTLFIDPRTVTTGASRPNTTGTSGSNKRSKLLTAPPRLGASTFYAPLSNPTHAQAINTEANLELTRDQLNFLRKYGFNTFTKDSFSQFKTNVMCSSRTLTPSNLSQEGYVIIKLGNTNKANITITLGQLKVTAQEYLDVVGSIENNGDLCICKQITPAEYQTAKAVQKTLQEEYGSTTANCITQPYQYVLSKNCMIARHVKNGDPVFLGLGSGNQQTSFALAQYISLLEKHEKTAIIYQVGDKHSEDSVTLYQLPIVSKQKLDARKILFNIINNNFKNYFLEDLDQPIIEGRFPSNPSNPGSLGGTMPCFVVDKHANVSQLTITLLDAQRQAHIVPFGNYNKVVKPLQLYNNDDFDVIQNIGYESFSQAYQALQIQDYQALQIQALQALSNQGIAVDINSFIRYPITQINITRLVNGVPKQLPYFLIDTSRTNQDTVIKLSCGNSVKLKLYLKVISRPYRNLKDYSLELIHSVTQQVFIQHALCLKLAEAYDITEITEKKTLLKNITSVQAVKMLAELITELAEYKKNPQTQNYTLNKAINQLILKYHPDKNPNAQAIAHQKTYILNALKN